MSDDESTVHLEQVLNAGDISSDQRVAAVSTNHNLILLKLRQGYKGLELEESHFVRKHVHDNTQVSLKPIIDVRFNPSLPLAHYLATSASSGAIAVWNIEYSKGNPGQWQPDYVLKEHNQAANVISWHFSNPHTLLTGSNDSKIKLWDLRVQSRSTLSISPKSSAVRDVQFRKVEGSHRFAAAFGNGTVQVWDVRHPKAAELVYSTAHDTAYAVDWNPDMNSLLASGGRDGLIKVWDVMESMRYAAAAPASAPAAHIKSERSTTVRRSKRKHHYPIQTIVTPEKPVMKLRWRPDHPYQIASGSLRGSTVHVWNTSEPHVPLACINCFDATSTTTGFVWLDQFLMTDDVIGSSIHDTHWWEVTGRLSDESDGSENSGSRSNSPMAVGSRSTRGGFQNWNSPSPTNKQFMNSVTEDTSPDVSVAGSVASRDASSVMNEESTMSFARQKESQRQRFRQFKHRHRQDEECARSWGLLLACSNVGDVSILDIAQATRPLEKHRSTSMSVSALGKIAVHHETIPDLRTTEALLLTKPLGKGFLPSPPQNIVRVLAPKQLDWKAGNIPPASNRVRATVANALVGFDAPQFTFFAKNYVSPSTLQENMESVRRLEMNLPPELTTEENQVNHDIALCCEYNAHIADQGASPAIAQVWRLLKLLYVPGSVPELISTSRSKSASNGSRGVLPTDPALNVRNGTPRELNVNVTTTGSPATTPPRSPPGALRKTSLTPTGTGTTMRKPTRCRTYSNPVEAFRLVDKKFLAPLEERVPTEGDSAGDDTGGESGDRVSESISQDAEEEKYQYNSDTGDSIGSKGTRAKVIAINDPIPDSKSYNGLWLGSSLDLLSRLSSFQPLDEKDFQVNAPRLEQDKQELVDALAKVKQIPAISPVPSGHRRRRKQQRRLRRQQYTYYYNMLYDKQLGICSRLNESTSSVDREQDQLLREGVISEHEVAPRPKVDTFAQDKVRCPSLVLSSFSVVEDNQHQLRSSLVREVLEHHADNGDVQTCVMIVLVLGDALQPAVDKKFLSMWFCSYIDLLQQLQMFSVAARIISSCGSPEVERCYQMTSLIAEGCSTCALSTKKNIVRASVHFSGACGTCKNTISRCSICQQAVRGVYVWCQGCGHGGHLDHLTQWFKTETECPTGCGHTCSLTPTYL